MNYSDNYLKKGLIMYPPKLKMIRSVLMLTEDDRREVVIATNDSALRLYEYYISKRGWKHFSPIAYEAIGKDLGWSRSKTEKTKTMLIKAGYLLILKDTLKDHSLIYRVLLGKPVVTHYKDTGNFPEISGAVDE